MQTLHTYYYQKTFRVKKDGTAPIVVRVSIDGKRVEIPTGASIEPDRWDQDKQSAVGRSEDTMKVNSIIKNLDAKIINAYNRLTLDGFVDADEIKDVITGKNNKTMGLLQGFDEHHERFKQLVKAGERSDSTLKKYKTIRSHLADFLKHKDIPIKKADSVLTDDFHHYLITEKGIGNDTTVRYVRGFGDVVRFWKRKGFLDHDPVENYSGRKKDKDTIYLTQPELNALIEFETDDDIMELVKDMFIFACYTGMAHADLRNLKMSSVIDTEDKKWIVYARDKTEKPTTVPLMPQAIEIFNKYEKYREITGNDKVFPVPSNQHTNRTLKPMIKALGIKKDITFHKARHTFATTVTLAKGATIEQVSNAWS